MFAIAACGGGGGSLAGDAEEQSTAACSCTDFDCTTEYIAWFNKVSITQEDDLAALSGDDRSRYDTARTAAADCQDALR